MFEVRRVFFSISLILAVGLWVVPNCCQVLDYKLFIDADMLVELAENGGPLSTKKYFQILYALTHLSMIRFTVCAMMNFSAEALVLT